MLRFQPSERLSAEDALHHSFITRKTAADHEREEEEEEEEGYKTPDTTEHTSSSSSSSSSDSSPQLNISNSSDSGIMPDSTSCAS